MTKQVLRTRGRPATEFANEGEVSKGDARILPSSTGREEGRAPDEPLSDFEAEASDHEAGAQPRSAITGGPQGATPDEDDDGFDEVGRALRDAAESPVGRREVGK